MLTPAAWTDGLFCQWAVWDFWFDGGSGEDSETHYIIIDI